MGALWGSIKQVLKKGVEVVVRAGVEVGGAVVGGAVGVVGGVVVGGGGVLGGVLGGILGGVLGVTAGVVVVICAKEIYVRFINPQTGLVTQIIHNVGDDHVNAQYGMLDEIPAPYQIPNLPQWEIIEIDQDQKTFLTNLTKVQFNSKNFQKYKCPRSKQFMREPVTLECCQNKLYCEKTVAIHWFNQGKTICPIPKCSKPSNQNNITYQSQPIQMAKQAIETIRKRLLVTFQRQGLSDDFKQIINKAFGLDYVQNHIQNN